MSDEEPQQPQTEEQQDETLQRIPYTQENLINDHNLRHTDFHDKLIKSVDDALIYESAKRAMRVLINNYFSDNRFLANLQNTSSGYRNDIIGTSMDLEKEMIFMTASFMPSDLKNPDLTELLMSIMSTYRIIQGRSSGGTRERILNGKYRVSQESTQAQSISTTPLTQAQPQQKKKGFLSFLGGN